VAEQDDKLQFVESGIVKSTISPYRGRTVVLTTKHGKERSLARPFRSALGVTVKVAVDIDTDTLGTFTGEIARVGTPKEVAIAKARLGLSSTAEKLGLASEGSFGPHPQIPWLAVDHELLAFVDQELSIEVIESLVTDKTNFGHCRARQVDELEQFVQRSLFPSHALIVRPNDGIKPGFLFKGIVDNHALASAVVLCSSASGDGLAHVETDMRAHMNPTRRRVIRQAAIKLVRRLCAPCPACGAPGWGQTGTEIGLPCRTCGEPTELISREIFGCTCCHHRAAHPRSDGQQVADEAQCPLCNP
jgi:hypothetical protein